MDKDLGIAHEYECPECGYHMQSLLSLGAGRKDAQSKCPDCEDGWLVPYVKREGRIGPYMRRKRK